MYDRPSIALTSSGLIDVMYTQASTDLSTLVIMGAWSADGGQTWTRNAVAGPGSSDSFRNVARICQPGGGGPSS